jgi:hypothetical protein
VGGTVVTISNKEHEEYFPNEFLKMRGRGDKE